MTGFQFAAIRHDRAFSGFVVVQRDAVQFQPVIDSAEAVNGADAVLLA